MRHSERKLTRSNAAVLQHILPSRGLSHLLLTPPHHVFGGWSLSYRWTGVSVHQPEPRGGQNSGNTCRTVVFDCISYTRMYTEHAPRFRRSQRKNRKTSLLHELLSLELSWDILKYISSTAALTQCFVSIAVFSDLIMQKIVTVCRHFIFPSRVTGATALWQTKKAKQNFILYRVGGASSSWKHAMITTDSILVAWNTFCLMMGLQKMR